MKYPPEVWKRRKFEDTFHGLRNVVYKQQTMKIWMNGCILPFPKKTILKSLRIKKTSKIYNVTHLNDIQNEIEKILRKNQNRLRRNQSLT